MTARALSVVVLAVAALLMSAVVMAAGLFIARSFGWATGIWLAPSTVFVSTMVLFFAGRRYVLPPHLTTTSRRALAAIGLWNTMAMLVTITAVWGVQRAPDIGAIRGVAILIVWLFSIVVLGSWLANRDRRGYSH